MLLVLCYVRSSKNTLPENSRSLYNGGLWFSRGFEETKLERERDREREKGMEGEREGRRRKFRVRGEREGKGREGTEKYRDGKMVRFWKRRKRAWVFK